MARTPPYPLRLSIVALLSCAPAFAQNALAPSQTAKTGLQPVEIQVPSDNPWNDTSIDLKPGETIRIEAKGALQYSNAQSAGPDGLKRGWMDAIRILPVNEAGRGALIGRIGNDIAARPFLIGAKRELKVPIAGRLYLGINQQDGDKSEGSYTATIVRTAAAENRGADTGAEKNMPGLTQDMLNQVPLRVADAAGNPGDRTNFIIVGSEEQMRSALEAAGWVKVDSSVSDSVLRGVLATLSHQAYVTVPMSPLMLYGRIQDYGFAQADPVRVVTSRHHFRIWKAPFTLGGRTVWVGAGTHDIGLEPDQRNGKLTHKIDPQTDLERDYIGQSLKDTGQVAKVDYMTTANPVKEAKTATGGGFSSDGRTVIIYLQPEPAAPAK
jgi:hypothetical protein